jgi:hypothetical protein
MDEQPPKGKGLTARVAGKLALLLGSGLAMINGTSATDTTVATPTPSVEAVVTGSNKRSNLFPAKLILKQNKHGFKMIAQHDSHSSHSSHSSHASHSSHNSHNSHTSHSSHDSHASHSSHDSHSSHTSHASGGFA